MSGVPLRVALALVRLSARMAPRSRRERLRREWEAELIAEASAGRGGWRLVLAAFGAVADARTLRSVEGRGAFTASTAGDAQPGLTTGWAREARVAVRSLLRAPGYTAVAVLTLGVGLGGSAAIYTLLDRLVLDPLPYPEPERLVRLMNRVPPLEEPWNTSSAQYVHFADHAERLDAIGLYRMGGANLLTPTGPERVRTASVTVEVLPLLGARAHRGRTFSDADMAPDSPAAAVLSHGFWTRAFGADPAVVGRTLSLNDTPVEVIGVLAPGVELPDAPPGFSTDVWRPLRIDRAGAFYNDHNSRMIGRLAPGADAASAESELARLTLGLPEAFPQAYSPSFIERGFRPLVTPLADDVTKDVAGSLWIVFGGVGLVLVIACANVANLFLVRMEARRRELAVRTALGAGRGQVARYLLSEGMVLAGAGAALALAVSRSAVGALAASSFTGLPRIDGLVPGGETVLFTLLLALAVGAGLAAHPLWVHAGGAGAAALGEGGRGASGGPGGGRFRSALVVTQVAMALVLAISAGLLVDSMRRLTAVDPGFDAEGALTVDLDLTQARYPDDASRWQLFREALERIRSVPGVVAAGMSTELPLRAGYGCTVQGFEDPAVRARIGAGEGLTTCAGQEPTTPGFFEAMGMPVVRGRAFEDGDLDEPTRAVVVVSEAFAGRFWPGEDPIGKRVAPNGGDDGFYTVVGVVGDVPNTTLDGERAIAIYYPAVPDPSTGMSWFPSTMRLVVRTDAADPLTLLTPVREAIHRVDPQVPLANPLAMDDLVARSMARLRFTSLLLALAAGTSLLLAAVGLYGVVAYAVTRRTREIGTRMAIGARPAQVEAMVVAQSMTLVGVGLVIGVGAALAGTRVLQGMLYGVAPTDPRAFASAAVLLTLVAFLASWIPARRAARVDPSVALREG